MPIFTTDLAGRELQRRIRFTDDEAVAMHDLGFRFSLFQPATREFNLSLPVTLIKDLEHGKLIVTRDL